MHDTSRERKKEKNAQMRGSKKWGKLQDGKSGKETKNSKKKKNILENIAEIFRVRDKGKKVQNEIEGFIDSCNRRRRREMQYFLQYFYFWKNNKSNTNHATNEIAKEPGF